MATPVILPTYSVGGWSANVDDDFGCRWVVTAQTLHGGASRKLHATERPFGMGAYRARSYLSARSDTVQGWCQAPDFAGAVAARDRLLGVFPDGTQLALVKTDGISTRQLLVELDSTAIKIEGWADAQGFDWQLPFYAADPRWLDTTVQTAGPFTVIGTATDGLDWGSGGLDWANGGLDWGSSGNGGVLSLNNPGTAPTWPVFTIAGPLTNPTFTNPATGDVISYTGTIEAGQTLVIDTSPFTRSVALNGVDRFGFLASAQWIEIPPGGQVTVQFSGTGAGTVTATWQYAYN
ncbi:phage tail domain-containing protein [Amycolatopsis sp. Hca4]|uniref:phage distal tail protein n=1 Tax=Amycolatopsis sp. Hca4 TaxID=2742131 RepID=UPI00158FF1EE|nr:phage tail domain-containing protein [Amycolatopsis sp. Hca4]QKV74533.1 phage tail family protein [Amycolatopsis sp. Hca4]